MEGGGQVLVQSNPIFLCVLMCPIKLSLVARTLYIIPARLCRCMTVLRCMDVWYSGAQHIRCDLKLVTNVGSWSARISVDLDFHPATHKRRCRSACVSGACALSVDGAQLFASYSAFVAINHKTWRGVLLKMAASRPRMTHYPSPRCFLCDAGPSYSLSERLVTNESSLF